MRTGLGFNVRVGTASVGVSAAVPDVTVTPTPGVLPREDPVLVEGDGSVVFGVVCVVCVVELMEVETSGAVAALAGVTMATVA